MEIPKVIKFKNGELIIAFISDATDGFVHLENPIAAVSQSVMQGDLVGETFVLKPWIGITEDKSFFVKREDILTICSLRENLIQQYKSYAIPSEAINSPDIEDNLGLEDIMEAKIRKSRNLLN